LNIRNNAAIDQIIVTWNTQGRNNKSPIADANAVKPYTKAKIPGAIPYSVVNLKPVTTPDTAKYARNKESKVTPVEHFNIITPLLVLWSS
jgi:hypothetical protein